MLKVLKILLTLSVYLNLSHCDDYGGRSSNQGIKSYGGVFQDANPNQNNGAYQTYQQLNQQFTPYGWNYNNQPQRTYGGVIQQSPQRAPQGFGWFGAGNQYGNQYENQFANPAFPKVPTLFLPNFVPPVYYPNTLPFPNYNPFPTPNYNHGSTNQNHPGPFGVFPGNSQHGHQHPQNNGNNFHNQYTNNHDSTDNIQQPAPTTVNRIETTDNRFPTNAFFKPTENRPWTNDDEQKWQATTKAPYFENKVPGLQCTLPAAAVLGATTAFKASSLLPLNIPVGKPILSCNATELLQAQINLNGIIYDCQKSSITLSCPRFNSHNLLVDDCQGETLECDVRMNANSKSVSCTNGTLISNHPVVCKSAALMANKNVLNCIYKAAGNSEVPTFVLPTRRPATTPRPYELTTSRTTSVIPLAPVTEHAVENIDTRHGENTEPGSGLMHEVKTAMKSVFPHDLLSKAPRQQMYLPPKKFEMAEIPKELKSHLVGVFPHDLFAMSQMGDLNQQDADSESRLSTSRNNVNNRQQLLSEWDVNANRKSGNSGTFIKTTSNQLPSRFGGVDDEDGGRLIFSP